MPEELDTLERQIRQLEIEREAIKRENDQQKLKELNTNISNLMVERDTYKAKWKAEKELVDKIQQAKATIEQLKIQADKAERYGDYGKVAEIRYGKIQEQEKLIEERFEYIKLIKSFVGKIYWKDFSANSFPGTIVYFNDSASYFINPLSEMKDKVSKYSVLENEYDWSIWKLRMPFDSTPYVMETQFQFNPKAKVYINYRRPVLFCSSPELMKREKENITNTQQWSIALMHELYHQYQYSNEAILTYVLRLYDEKKWMDMDSLQVLYLKDK